MVWWGRWSEIPSLLSLGVCVVFEKKRRVSVSVSGGNFVMDSLYAWIYVGVVGMHVFGGRSSDVCVCVRRGAGLVSGH